jgi:hypothetical protein
MTPELTTTVPMSHCSDAIMEPAATVLFTSLMYEPDSTCHARAALPSSAAVQHS